VDDMAFYEKVSSMPLGYEVAFGEGRDLLVDSCVAPSIRGMKCLRSKKLA